MSGVVQRGGGSLKIAGAREANEAVAQIFSLKQEEYNKDHDKARCRER